MATHFIIRLHILSAINWVTSYSLQFPIFFKTYPNPQGTGFSHADFNLTHLRSSSNLFIGNTESDRYCF
jgi:hypothetical protein